MSNPDFNEEILKCNKVYARIARLYDSLGLQATAFGNTPAGTVASDARAKLSDILGLIERGHYENQK